MAAAPPTQPAISLLRALLDTRAMVPELYDVMDRVQEAAVQAHAPSVRATCASLFLQFFLDYPLGDTRVKQHLHVCLRNLEFKLEEGRAQVGW